MSDTTPRAWLCKHCTERVDPTMDLCWNCGHDRAGVAHPTIFVEPVEVDLTRCDACFYPLKGNPDATHCPECGAPVPWLDCPACGVRGSRLEMAQGCPACKAAEAGITFEPAVKRTGGGLEGEHFDTDFDLHDKQAAGIEHRGKRASTRWLIALVMLLIPGGIFITVTSRWLAETGNHETGHALAAAWAVTLALVFLGVLIAIGSELFSPKP